MSDVLSLADVFQKVIEVSIKEVDFNPLNCVSLRGYTWQCGIKNSNINLQTLQEKGLIFTLENFIRGGINSVMGDRHVASDGIKTIFYRDAFNLYVSPMSEFLPYDEIEMWHGYVDLYMKKLEEIFNTPDNSDIGYFDEVDLNYNDEIR